ncbi:MAG: tyrosine-type recombinase/integrase [Actinobacteria bacterium]|nr:tyrosine-type recombinase/integrase [Actinomycetota bacterium]
MLEKYLAKYLNELKMRGRSKWTVKSYKNYLERFIEWTKFKHKEDGEFDLSKFNCKEARDFRNYLVDLKLSPATINVSLSALRSFLDFLVEEEVIKGNPIIPSRLRVYGSVKEVNFLTEEELNKVLNAMTDLPANVELAFHVMLATGLRVSEVSQLTKEDVISENGQVIIRVRCGKGRKERYVPMVDEITARNLLQYLEIKEKVKNLNGWSPYRRGKKSGPKTGKIDNTIFEITDGVLKNYCLRISQDTNVPFHSHRLRHTMATKLLRKGAPIEVVQQFLGHVNIATTARYAKVLPEAVLKWGCRIS